MIRKSSFGLAMLTLSAVAVLQSAALATEATVVAERPAVASPAPKKGAPLVTREILSPMHQEIFDAVEAERIKVEELNARFTRALLPADRLAIQKEIEAVKKAGIIAVFGIQLRYAQAAGRAEAAAQLEAAIEAVRNPKPPQVRGETMLERAGQAGGK